MWVIKSAAESGDGVSIEREQPSTTFRSMAAFMKLGDIKGEFQADELTGTFNALNETTNVRPSKGESISIVHPAFKTGYDPGPVGSADGFDRSSVFWEISQGSYRSDDDLNDGLTGEGRPMNSWRNADPSPFEDRTVGDYDTNDAVFDMRQNIGSTAGPGGSSFMTETFEPAAGMNSFGESLNPVLEIGTNSGPGGSTYMTGSIGCQTMPPCSLGGSAGPGGDDI